MTTIEAQVILPCLPERALVAFTQSADTQAWWQGCITQVEEAAGMLCWQWRAAETGHWRYLTQAHIRQWVPGVFLELDQVWQFSCDETEPLGPTRLLIEATPQVHQTLLVIRHMDIRLDSEAWRRYHLAVQLGWQRSLADLRDYLTQQATPWR